MLLFLQNGLTFYFPVKNINVLEIDFSPYIRKGQGLSLALFL
jgi:hypothetical protein